MEGNLLILFLVLMPIVGGIVCYIIGRRNKVVRNYFAIFITFFEVIVMISIFKYQNSYFLWNNFGISKIYFIIDGFRLVYGLIAAFMWLCTTIFSHEYFKHYRNRNRYYLFTLITLGATMGVLFSADFITTFLFFEIMSFTSYVMVIHDEKEKSKDAAKTYMAVAVIGGLALLLGIFLIQYHLGTTEFEGISQGIKSYTGDKKNLYIAGILMMLGFGGKAGIFPIHIWLPNAHPSAPAPASALLSGILTKTGIFGAAVISSNLFLHDEIWGMGILIFGVITMFLGAFLALFSIDLKRTLACSSVSQIGFIVVGLGMQGILGNHNALAVRGTILHMVNHSLIKLVLFMAAGVIYMNLHELDLNKIRGYGKNKPILLLVFGIGVLSIIGMPLGSGYISKTLLHESILEKIWMFENASNLLVFYNVIEWIFTISGGFTTAYMLKLFIAIFFEENNYRQEEFNFSKGNYMTVLSAMTLLVPAILLIILGTFTGIMDIIANLGQDFFYGINPIHEVHYFIWINLKGAIKSLTLGLIVYFLIRKFLIIKDEMGKSLYISPWQKYLNLEECVYKPILGKVLPLIGEYIARFIGDSVNNIGLLIYIVFKQFEDIYVYSNKKIMSLIEKLEIVEEDKLSSKLSYSLFQFTAGLLLIMTWVILMK